MSMTSSVSSTNTSSLTQPTGAVGKKELNKADFLTLFITQLQYQDPMKPMDSYEMASQLAQFSSMEATHKMSENMEKLLDYQTSQNNLQTVSLLGNTVMVEGNGMAVSEGKASSTEFIVDEEPAALRVTIYDAANKPVWESAVPPHDPGVPYKLAWDGNSASGTAVPDGPYHYQVQAMSLTGEELPVTYHSTGKVTDVRFGEGGTTLTIDGNVEAKMSDVLKVQGQ